MFVGRTSIHSFRLLSRNHSGSDLWLLTWALCGPTGPVVHCLCRTSQAVPKLLCNSLLQWPQLCFLLCSLRPSLREGTSFWVPLTSVLTVFANLSSSCRTVCPVGELHYTNGHRRRAQGWHGSSEAIDSSCQCGLLKQMIFILFHFN